MNVSYGIYSSQTWRYQTSWQLDRPGWPILCLMQRLAGSLDHDRSQLAATALLAHRPNVERHFPTNSGFQNRSKRMRQSTCSPTFSSGGTKSWFPSMIAAFLRVSGILSVLQTQDPISALSASQNAPSSSFSSPNQSDCAPLLLR